MLQRISMAKELIIQNEFNVAEIAEKTGFHDVKYFSKCFKKQVGVPPSDYIKNH